MIEWKRTIASFDYNSERKAAVKRALRTGTLAIGALFAQVTLSAQPTSIIFESRGTSTDGKPFDDYIVKCSDGKSEYLTAWDDRRQWCIGKDSNARCETKQIKAAKAACK